jgi:tetratricopeptide (TPR) repeat protein
MARWLVVLGLVLLLAGGGVFAWQRWGGSREETAGTAFHWRQAHEALQAQDFARACEQLRLCLDQSPAHAETHFLLARAARRADDLESAQTHLGIAEALGWTPEEVATERLLTKAQLGALGETEATLFARLDERPVPDELILEALIKGYLVVYRLPEAADLATRWIDRSPDRWQPWLYRGRAHYLNHNLGRAAADYRRALEVMPNHRKGRLWYASALVLDGRFADALPSFQKYVEDYPDDAAGLLGLAECLLNLKRRAEAEEVLVRLLEKYPKHIPGLFLRSRLEMDRDAPQQALVWLKRAEELAPHEPDVVQGLILAYRKLGKDAEVKRYQERHQELRKLTRRLDDLRTQILRSPGEVAPRVEAGELSAQLGQTSEALDWLLGALALDVNHRPTHRALARCFEKMGEKNLAEYHRARGADPAGK